MAVCVNQSSGLEFRLVFFSFKSSVWPAISQPRLDQFVRKLVRFSFSPIIKQIKNFAKMIHHELRYGVSDGTFEAKKDQPKFQTRALVLTSVKNLTTTLPNGQRSPVAEAAELEGPRTIGRRRSWRNSAITFDEIGTKERRKERTNELRRSPKSKLLQIRT